MIRRIIPFAIFLCALLLYVSTLHPHVGFTDAGELAGACVSLGVAHPTGYPLFVILGHAWLAIPLSLSPVTQMNLFAAVCTAAASAVMYLLLVLILEWWDEAISIDRKAGHTMSNKRVSGAKKKTGATTADNAGLDSASVSSVDSSSGSWHHITLAAGGALCFATARTVWEQATGIEVYSLHLMLMMTTLYFFLRGIRFDSMTWLYGAAVGMGLAFANHLTTVLIVVPVAYLFFRRPGQTWSFSNERMRAFAALLAIILPFSLFYVWLPLLSSAQPLFNWGEVHRSWDAFSYHVFGKQYSVWMFSDEPGAVRKQFSLFLSLLPHNLAYAGVAASVAGIVILLRSRTLRSLGVFFLLMVVCGVGYSVNYSIHDVDSYFLSSFTALLVCCVVALHALFTAYPRFAPLCLALPLIGYVDNRTSCDQHDNVLVREYVHMMMDPLPRNAVVISQQWDFLCSAFWYMQQVEGYRKDIVVIEKELLRRTWYPGQLMRWYPGFISASSSYIDAYMKDLSIFESSPDVFASNPSYSRSIQRSYTALLRSFISNAHATSRQVFTTAEVPQDEPDFVEGYSLIPYGMCLAIRKEPEAVLLAPTAIGITDFHHATQRHHESLLERNIISIASRQILSNVNVALSLQDSAVARTYCDMALMLDSRNTGAIQARESLR